MIVTDHHRPGDDAARLPDRGDPPVRLPFPELCGTGVVCKLAQALLGVDVALSRISTSSRWRRSPTSCRSLDENRSLAIAGLRALARTQSPGLQALMQNARVDPAAVDAGAVGFRLAPRINAAGRLGRPDAALELLLTTDADEAEAPRRRAGDAEPRPPGRRGQDPAGGGRRGRVVARGEAPAAGLRRLGARTGTRA